MEVLEDERARQSPGVIERDWKGKGRKRGRERRRGRDI